MIIKQLEKLAFRLWSEGGGPYYLLVILFCAIFIAPPLVNAKILPSAVIHFTVVLVLFTGVFTVPCRVAVRLIALLITIAAVIGRIIEGESPIRAIAIAEIVLYVLVLTLFAALIIRQFLARGQAIKHRIAGAVAVYLLLGLLWARLYELVKLIDPGAFRIANDEGMATLFYFSFVTLVTIGYGDVVPVNLVARNLAILEGLTGQLYLVILISSLVAEQSTKTKQNEK